MGLTSPPPISVSTVSTLPSLGTWSNATHTGAWQMVKRKKQYRKRENCLLPTAFGPACDPCGKAGWGRGQGRGGCGACQR